MIFFSAVDGTLSHVALAPKKIAPPLGRRSNPLLLII